MQHRANQQTRRMRYALSAAIAAILAPGHALAQDPDRKSVG